MTQTAQPGGPSTPTPPAAMPAEFGLPTATFIIVASMVGVGVLTTSGFTVLFVGSNQLMLALWVLGAVTAACGALTLCELTAALPETGGDYVYLRESYGPLVAFLSGWVSFVIGFAAPSASAAFGAAKYLTAPTSLDGPTAVLVQRGLATALIVVFALIHVSGRKQTAQVQGWVTALKLILLGLFVIAGVAVGWRNVGHLADPKPVTPDVLTGSMEPTIPTGSVVMVRPVDPGTLEVGDIATYQKKEAEDTYITHRITDVDTSGRQTRFIFKGDANRGPDLRPVPASAIRGEVWFHVPYLGSIRNVAAGPAGLGLLAMLLLAGYAALQVVGVLRDRRRAGDGTTAPIAAEVADARALVLVELATRELPNLDASEAARRLNGLAVREDADTCTVLISREQPPATQQTTDLVVARLGVAPLSQLSVDARGTLTLRVADLCAPGGDAGSAAPEKGQDRAEA